MAVILVRTDNWISHLPWTGPRPTVYGPADGLWYGNMAQVGNASGGTLSLFGAISRARKEDWVYILGGYSAGVSSATAMDIRFTFASGPVIPVNSGQANPFFEAQYPAEVGVGRAVALGSPGSAAHLGTPLFGDKKIAGDLALVTTVFESNVDLLIHQMSIWGFLIRYASFFRDVPASRG